MPLPRPLGTASWLASPAAPQAANAGAGGAAAKLDPPLSTAAMVLPRGTGLARSRLKLQRPIGYTALARLCSGRNLVLTIARK